MSDPVLRPIPGTNFHMIVDPDRDIFEDLLDDDEDD